MSESQAPPVALPEAVRNSLAQLRVQLQEAIGDQLVSMVLYGGLARGEWVAHRSDVNVMIVLKEVTVGVLDKVAPPIQQGMRDCQLAVLLVTEKDLRRSTDVFPTKFLDMKRSHLLLYGADLLPDLPIASDHLRLRCEQEIKNLLLRLREMYLRRSHRPELVEVTLFHSLSAFLASLRTLLQLKTGDAPVRHDAVAKAAASTLGIDLKTLQTLQTLKAGTSNAHEEELRQLYGAFMGEVEKAADIVDAL